MRTSGLRPRAIGALSIVAASLFLLLCLANYGQGGFETAGTTPWHLGVAGLFVEVFGAGAYSLVLLPLIWGLVVYFREDTPSLAMRAAGTLLLACSISMISGLLQSEGAADMTWAGAVGEYTVALTQGLAGALGAALALALAWTAAGTLFIASLVWATDWFFHSLRKGPVVPLLATRASVAVEPLRAELREAGYDNEYDDGHDDGALEREFVAMPTAGAQATAAVVAEPVAVAEPLPVHDLPEGFSVQSAGDRMLVRGPVGYEGVEFLPASSELARPAPTEERFAHDFEHEEDRLLDDELVVPAIDTIDAEAETAGDAQPESPAVPGGEPIATVEETLWTGAGAGIGTAATDANGPAREVVAAPPVPGDDKAATDRPRSGIGLPDDSPFVDEFFAVDVVVTDTYGATPMPADAGAVDERTGHDGASAAGEIEAAFGATIPSPTPPAAADSAEAPVSETGHDAAGPTEELRRDRTSQEPIIVDELLFADAYDIVDDEIPAPIAARSAAPEAAPEAALDRIHEMSLDPLFHDAVEAVLDAGRGSAMSLQRQFGIGHGRGLRLLQQMEAAGILGAEGEAGTRDVRIARADWEAFSGSNAP